jgi:predicted exporter
MSRRITYLLIAWVVATLLVLTYVTTSTGWRVRSNLLDLLPSTPETRYLARTAAKQGRILILAVASDQPGKAEAFADSLARDIRQSPLFERDESEARRVANASGEPDLSGGLGRLYWDHRYTLPVRGLENKAPDDTAALLGHLRKSLYSPMMATGNLVEDPLFQFQERIFSLQAMAGETGLCGGRPCVKRTGMGGDTTWVLVKANLQSGAFDAAAQDSLGTFLHKAEQKAARLQVRLVPDGLVLFARAGRERTEAELQLVSIGSTIAVALLMLLVFRGPAELLLGLTAAAFGLFCGGVWTHFTFGGLHLLTLIFGGTLIGVSADFSLHYFLMRRHGGMGKPGAWPLHFRSQAVALLTTLIAYLALALSQFGALRQIAIFCASGLASTFLFVWGVYPRVLSNTPKRGLPRWFIRASDIAHHNLYRPAWGVAAVLLFVLSVAGLFKLHVQDSLRAWQPPEPTLMAGDKLIRELFQAPSESRFFLIQGSNLEEALQREEVLGFTLDSVSSSGKPFQWQGLSRMASSRSRQEAHRAVATGMLDRPEARAGLTELGYEPVVIDSLRLRIARAPVLTPEEALAAVKASGLGDALGIDSGAGGWTLRVSLRGAVDDPLQGRTLPGVSWVDQDKGLARVLGGLRHEAEVISLLAYFVVCLLLLRRYGWKRGARIVLIVVAVPVLVLGLFGWMREPLQFFGLMGLVIALGTGVDHIIFVADADSESESGAMGAVLLTAVATLLSFGFLLFSSTPALRQFATTLMAGLFLFLVLAPLAAPHRTDPADSSQDTPS